MNETQLLKAAREGDERAFAELVEAHRGPLYAHCYQMLGSVHDADDAVQEALLKAWRALVRFEARSSLRTWLYTIATNVCLRMIEQRPSLGCCRWTTGRRLTRTSGLGPPLLESRSVEPVPDRELGLAEGLAGPEARYEQREAIELAFIAALQHLPARQRAVLILRDVLGFSGAEVADALDTTAASVYSLLQRAHATIDDRLPDRSQQATLRALDDEQLRDDRRPLHRGLGTQRRGRDRPTADRERDARDAADRHLVPRTRGDRDHVPHRRVRPPAQLADAADLGQRSACRGHIRT